MSRLEAEDTGTGNFGFVKMTNNRVDINTTNLLREASDDGQFYSWTVNYNASAGDHIIYIRNTSLTKELHLVSAEVSIKTAATVTFNRVDGTGTGVDATEVNWNFGSPNIADVSALEDAGTVGTVTEMQCVRLPNEGNGEFSLFGALTLNNGGDGVTIQISKGSDVCATIIGYYL